ncbi:MAG: arylsulfotransferase family protein [Gemmatimonadaceae bacterium]
MRWRGTLGAALLTAACMREPSGPSSVAPTIGRVLAATNPYNVLGATVSVVVSHADSVAVRFRLTDVATSIDSTTPGVQTLGDSAVVPVLGLLPERRYTFRPIAYWPGGVVVGDANEITTRSLPADIPSYTASGSNPSPGYVVFAAGTYGLVVDNTGRVVWYRQFPNGPGLNFMAQPNGHYTARPTTPDPGDIEPWVELDAFGNITRTIVCGLGLQSRFHDLIAEPDGGVWLMCDETRAMDLTASGGVANARVTGTAVQHLSPTGALLFHWSPFDHLAIADLDPADRTGANVNWTHGNAIDVDVDRNVIVSFRSLEEITKINVVTGDVIWRMGGRANQFTFLDSPVRPFSRQHGMRVSAPGTLLILDNVGNPFESRAEIYAVNEVARTARLTRSYASTPAVVTLIGGSVQSLPSGRTLVSYGTAGRVEEYDSAGRVLWRIDGNAGYVFRAQRIQSLYKPGVGTAR